MKRDALLGAVAREICSTGCRCKRDALLGAVAREMLYWVPLQEGYALAGAVAGGISSIGIAARGGTEGPRPGVVRVELKARRVVSMRRRMSRPRGVADSFGAPVGSKPICTVPKLSTWQKCLGCNPVTVCLRAPAGLRWGVRSPVEGAVG